MPTPWTSSNNAPTTMNSKYFSIGIYGNFNLTTFYLRLRFLDRFRKINNLNPIICRTNSSMIWLFFYLLVCFPLADPTTFLFSSFNLCSKSFLLIFSSFSFLFSSFIWDILIFFIQRSFSLCGTLGWKNYYGSKR
jgi:hypothetical protein